MRFISIIVFSFLTEFLYSKEYILLDIKIYPDENYPIFFLCLKDSDDCLSVDKNIGTYDLIDCFKKNTTIMAEYFQLDEYYRELKYKNISSVDSLIGGMELYHELEEHFKTIIFLLNDKTYVEVRIAKIASDLLKTTDVGRTSLGIESDYFMVPYNFKYARKYDGSADSLFCWE